VTLREIQELGVEAFALRADMTDRAQLEQLAKSVLSISNSSLDLLVHNAANFERVLPDKLDESAWNRAISLNTTAPYLLSVALSQALRDAGGCVIGIGCLSALRPWKNYIPYSVSKAAFVHMIKGLALSLSPHARANVILPGTVEPPEPYDAELIERLRIKAPLERIGEADDVARAVIFLAQNDFITGQAIAVDGGRSVV
jgi:pteridine reductase